MVESRAALDEGPDSDRPRFPGTEPSDRLPATACHRTAYAWEDTMNRDLLLARTTRRTLLKAGGAAGLGVGLAGQCLASVMAQEATVVYPSWMLGEAGVGDYWMAS